MSNLECVSVNDEGAHQRGIFDANYVAQGPVYNIQVHGCGALHAGNAEIPSTLNEPKSPLIATQDFTDFKNKLKEFYKELTFPCIAWLDEAEDLNIDEFFIDLKLDESATTITKEDIFNPVQQQRPTRILMEGQPGSGKTSLVTRIVYDWANEEEYVAQFELVFLLPLRELQQQSVDDAIKSIGNISGFKDSSDKVDEIISCNEQHILFIFDGLDELSVDDRAPILKLLYKQKYSEVTMLVTCRTGLFALTKGERKQLFQGINRQSKFWNKQISILGIKNNEKKMEFLEKFIIMDESVKHNVVAGLKSTVSTTELFDCPLFLILLAFIVNTEEGNVGTFLTRTELYKKLFNCIIKHSCAKNQIALDDCFDLFDCESSSHDLRESIKEFGKLSLRNILENNLQFKSDSLTQQIYKVGFLCNHKQVVRFKSNQYYEAFHLSILEFSAAYYVWMEYKSKKCEFSEKLLKPVVQHYLRTRETSLVLRFMIGLFQEHSRDIFDCMRPFSCFFSSTFRFLENLMDEYPSADDYEKVFPTMIHLLPVHLELKLHFSRTMIVSESFGKLIEYGIKCGKIKSIYGSSFIRTPCLKNFHAPCVKITVDETEDLHDIITHFACNVNELHILMPPIMPSTADAIRIASTIESFKSASCSLKLYCDESSYINRQILVPVEEMFEKYIYFFPIIIKTDIEKQFAIKLSLTIEVLHVYLESEELDLTDLFNAIASSGSLLYFAFDTLCMKRDTAIDLSDLTNGGTKRYEYLDLKKCIVSCRQPLINRNCINILSINGVSRETLCEIEPTNLLCTISDVAELLEMNPAWPGVNSIKCIHTRESCKRKIEDKRVFEFLSICKSLRILEISSKLFADAEGLVEGLMQLEIEKFIYIYDGFEGLDLFKTWNENWTTENKMKLQTIDIIYERVAVAYHSETHGKNCILPAMLELVKGLLQGHWKRVNFVCRDVDFFLFMANDKCVIDVSIFNVVHYMYGSDNDDPDYYKFLFNQHGFSFSMLDAFAITMK